MEYTKGEWKAQKNGAGEWSIITDDEFIGTVSRHFNAHLIASAPDLYEAVKMCCQGQKGWIDVMHLALAKAEGK